MYYTDTAMLVVGSFLYLLDVVLEVEGFAGYWVIFTPFVPGFIWSLYMKMITHRSTVVRKPNENK